MLQTDRSAVAALYDCATDALPDDGMFPRHQRIMKDIDQFTYQDSLATDHFDDALKVANEIETLLT